MWEGEVSKAVLLSPRFNVVSITFADVCNIVLMTLKSTSERILRDAFLFDVQKISHSFELLLSRQLAVDFVGMYHS